MRHQAGLPGVLAIPGMQLGPQEGAAWQGPAHTPPSPAVPGENPGKSEDGVLAPTNC